MIQFLKNKYKEFNKWDSEFIGIVIALLMYHVFQALLYWYDNKSTLISLDYLGTVFVGTIYILIADYVAIQGVKRRHKPIYEYYRKVKEVKREDESVDRKTQLNLDMIDVFHINNQHRTARIWIFQRTYFFYFFLTLVVFLVLNL